jgi:hypothetical protein
MRYKPFGHASRNEEWQGDPNQKNSSLQILQSIPSGSPAILPTSWDCTNLRDAFEKYKISLQFVHNDLPDYIQRCIQLGRFCDLVGKLDNTDGTIGAPIVFGAIDCTLNAKAKEVSESARIISGKPMQFWAIKNPLQRPTHAPASAPKHACAVTSSSKKARGGGEEKIDEKTFEQEDEGERYIVKSIGAHRVANKSWEFLVEWQSSNEKTWEKFGNLKTNVILLEYLKNGNGSRDLELVEWVKRKRLTWTRESERKLYQFIDQ